MKFYRPHSFFALLLMGFIFVSLPLMTALFSSIQILDGLVQQSAVAVFSSVDRVSGSRKLMALLHDQERKARLFQVLGDPQYLKEVNSLEQDLKKTLTHLANLNTDGQLAAKIKRVQAVEHDLVAGFNNISGGPKKRKKEQDKLLANYRLLNDLAWSVEDSNRELMTKEVDGLQQRVHQDKRMLIWQTSGLMLFSVLLIILFVILISKPVRQIDQGIERLGDGDFQTSIVVTGPRDLEILGQKLDWLRRRLAELDRDKIKLVAHISHELKTPLSSIKEGAALLRDELVGPMNTRQKNVVGILDKNCSKLQLLIENILDFNMAKVRETPEEQDCFRLDGLIQEVVTDHQNSVLARQITIEVQLSAVRVAGNRKQLKTVFDNLLSNAVKFTPDQGLIKIQLRVDSRLVVCFVEDSGPGIREEDRSRVFSPFFQGQGAKKTVVKGSGLGLAISKEYVQNHGGTIRLLPGKQGARFAVTLPVAV